MDAIDVRKLVLILSWLSIFTMLWLMILDVIPTKMLWSWGFTGIFLFIGLGAASDGSSRR